ncbi:aminoglycoside adenylyltransferase domain-containing protein [Fredinandcohnia humi]
MNKIPIKINNVLNEYFALLDSNLPDLLDSFYLYGSISIGAYEEGTSDIDFFAVLNRSLSSEELSTLQKIHSEMGKAFPRPILDGWYATKSDNQVFNQDDNPFLRFNEGRFLGVSRFNVNSVDAFQLSKYGITVRGPSIKHLGLEVDMEILMKNMVENLNTYWLNWLKNCRKFLSVTYIGTFVSLETIEWGVLGVSRLYYTLQEKDITSKIGAGEYALRNVPSKWHEIINESMRQRTENTKSYYSSIFKRRKDFIEYIDFMIMEINRIYNEGK